MNRIGLKSEEVIDFYYFVNELGGIKVTGIFSHYAWDLQIGLFL